jgi:hypothetical protein
MRWLALSMVLAACGGDFDPTGTYVGDATRSGEAMEMLTVEDSGGTMNSTGFNHSFSGTRVVVTRAGEDLLDVQLGDFCRVRARQGVGSGERECVLVDDQRCRIEMPAYTGEIAMSGEVSFSVGDSGEMSAMLNGNGSQGDPDAPGNKTIQLVYNFYGQRQP